MIGLDRNLARIGAIAGIAGPLLLVIYFATPAVSGWPHAGASPDTLIRYALGHEILFYADLRHRDVSGPGSLDPGRCHRARHHNLARGADYTARAQMKRITASMPRW
jgi:hypothetical protein